MKFTPAPWKASGWTVRKSNGFFFSQPSKGVTSGDITPEEFDKFDAEFKANAHLVAAAPEMYEALKMALEDITGPITDSGIRIRFATLDAVKAALSKAEGRDGREGE